MEQEFENYVYFSQYVTPFQTPAEGLSQYIILKKLLFSIFEMLRALSSTVFLHILIWDHIVTLKQKWPKSDLGHIAYSISK